MELKNKNITLRFIGGLGNQLFLLVFLEYLSRKLKKKIFVDTKSGYQNFLGGNSFKEKFHLYDLNYNFFSQHDKLCLLGIYGKIKRLLINRLKFFSSLYNTEYINEDKNHNIITRIKNSKKKYIYINGYFQNIRFFSGLENFIRKIIFQHNKSIKFLKLNLPKQKTLFICFSNYDYQKNSYKNIFIYKLKKFLENNEKFKYFVIFSAKKKSREIEQLINSSNIYYINNRSKNNRFYRILLISKYYYYFIDNSTYYWWGSWLSSFKRKKIYTPLEFHGDRKHKNLVYV